ncbi:MAG: hypothetical protein COZ06_38340 [Armatimonadetes bacterium CG_4_10_14_3_um_filter_66_18]|nr:ATP-binding protein [Armatimonadota bacterium]NDK16276.1 ATP-binding protein [Armatimonadota bacterium]PIY35341.1 MAG: hypothetical protein COZ06_38340 [Armatimonadetes bacterium CG_4_10_14_3_um_filter_66_18]
MITKIEARNYKCLRATSQRIRPFQVLVGPNASGKSTFFDSVLFLSDLLATDLEQAVRSRARTVQELTWGAEGTRFDVAVELRLPTPVRDNGAGSFTHCRYEVAVDTHPQEGSLRILTENFFLLKEPRPNATGQGVLELFPLEPASPAPIVLEQGKHTPKGWRKVISRKAEGTSYFRSESTLWNFPMKLAPLKPALGQVPEEERFGAANWAKQVLSGNVRALALDSRAMREPCPPDVPRTYLADGSNLPIVLKDLVEPESVAARRWVEHLRTALPRLRGVTVAQRESDNHPYLVAEFAGGLRVPSWLLSDGTLRLFALTLLAYLPPAHQHVYLIEEPENGIHPRAVETVYQSLSSVYAGQVLLASHSPLLLGLASLDDLLCFAQAPSGATAIVSGSAHPALVNWQRETPLEVLYAAGVLG